MGVELRRWTRIWGLLLSMALLVAACSGESDPASTDDDQATPDTTEAAAPDTTEATAPEEAENGGDDEGDDGGEEVDPLTRARDLTLEEAAALGDDVLVVGFTPGTMDLADFNGQFMIGMEQELERLGYNFRIIARTPADHSAHDQQLNIVEDLLTIGVDHLVIIPTNFESQFASYQAANEAGIPLTIGNNSTPFEGANAPIVHGLVGYSHADGGQIMGQHLIDTYDSDTPIGVIHLDVGNTDNGRVVTVIDMLNDAGYNLVAEEFGDANRDEAFAAAQDLLTAHPDIRVIYAGSSSMAMGALAAVEASPDHEPLADVDVYGFGANIEELEAMLDGRLAGSIFRDSLAVGAQAAEMIHAVQEGRGDEVINVGYDVPVKLVTSCEDIRESVFPGTFNVSDRDFPAEC